MRKIIFLLCVFGSVSAYSAINDSISTYLLNENALLVGGCDRGRYPFNIEDNTQIKDLVLRKMVRDLQKTNQEPTSFNFIINNKKIVINVLDLKLVDKFCSLEKPIKMKISFYNINHNSEEFNYLDGYQSVTYK